MTINAEVSKITQYRKELSEIKKDIKNGISPNKRIEDLDRLMSKHIESEERLEQEYLDVERENKNGS